MKKINSKIKRKLRNRKKLKSLNVSRFRISVSKSLNNLSAQIIDDKLNKTLVSVSSIEKQIKDKKIKIDNQEIKEILTINGVRFSFEDGSWGLIRASSNKPSLVVVTESPTSDERKLNIFKFIDKTLMKTGKIGEYDQKI